MHTLNARLSGKIALPALFVLLVYSAVFFRERMLYSDAAYILYNIINHKTLWIQEHRYGSFITQFFPLAGVWLKLPLSLIVFLYSISFNLFYFVSGMILFRLRQYNFLLLLAFYLTACATETFYWSNNEVHQGICWMLLTFGFLFYAVENGKSNALIIPVYTTLAFLALSSHPIVIVVTAGMFVFFFLDGQVFHRDKRTLLWVLIVLAMTGLKTYLSATGSYDKAKMGMMARYVLDGDPFKVLRNPTFTSFARFAVQDYWQALALFAAGLAYLLSRKKYRLAAWTLLSVLAYLVCVSIVYPASGYRYYLESEWMAVSLFALLPFCRFVLPQLNLRFAGILLLTFFSLRTLQILESRERFSNRFKAVARIARSLQQEHVPKAIIRQYGEDSALRNTLMLSWGLPCETLLLSAMEQKDRPVTALLSFTPQFTRQKLEGSETRDFINPFWNQWYTELNRDYFRFDTTKPYIVLDGALQKNTVPENTD
ncbi:MAG: hypothetical protein JNL13_08315 [Chitinophagaceae bacterium]|nr:hypothetical protein [Chitinophagaceae bacterium]